MIFLFRVTISEAEQRVKAAIDVALDAGSTVASVDVGDLIDVLERLNSARMRLLDRESNITRES